MSATDIAPMREIKLKDLKDKSPTELQVFAETHEVENASIKIGRAHV